jgi:hypothetical protein
MGDDRFVCECPAANCRQTFPSELWHRARARQRAIGTGSVMDSVIVIPAHSAGLKVLAEGIGYNIVATSDVSPSEGED